MPPRTRHIRQFGDQIKKNDFSGQCRFYWNLEGKWPIWCHMIDAGSKKTCSQDQHSQHKSHDTMYMYYNLRWHTPSPVLFDQALPSLQFLRLFSWWSRGFPRELCHPGSFRQHWSAEKEDRLPSLSAWSWSRSADESAQPATVKWQFSTHLITQCITE